MLRTRTACAGRPSTSTLRAPSMPRRATTPHSVGVQQRAAPQRPQLVPSRAISLDRGEPQKQGRPRVYVDSVGRILDHYVPPDKVSGWFAPKKLWSFLRSYTTWFWTRRRLIMQMGRKEWYAFKKEMAPRYVKFHEALAAGDGHALRSLMTEPGYNALKKTVSLERNRKFKYVWKIEGMQPIKVVSYGLLGGQIPGAGWTEYAQVLVRMKSRQSFAVYDADGKLISGDETFKPVNEYMIFEAHVKKGAHRQHIRIKLVCAPWKITTKVALNGKPIYELTSPDDNPGANQST